MAMTVVDLVRVAAGGIDVVGELVKVNRGNGNRAESQCQDQEDQLKKVTREELGRCG